MKTVRKATPIIDVTEDARSFVVVASDESVDRYGDIIRVAGWNLDSFRKNPIALWGHQHETPIGTVPEVWTEGTKLMAQMQLAPAGTDPFIDKLWNLVKAKVLRAVSVGFLPTADPVEIEGTYGFEYNGQELLELSLVSVPANPAALSVARSVCGDDVLDVFEVSDMLRRKQRQYLFELVLAEANSRSRLHG